MTSDRNRDIEPESPVSERDAPRGKSGQTRSADEEISLLGIVNVLLSHRRVVVLSPLVGAFLIVAVSLILPHSYTATASFTPESSERTENQISRLAGLAGQFGISVPTGGVGQSPQFYADLLRSRGVLEETVVTEYRLPAEGEEEHRRQDLVTILEIEEATRAKSVELAMERLRDDMLGVSTDPETGVVDISVTTHWPELSHQVSERLLELVNRFNLESRQSQAAAEREFIEGQVAKSESALRAAEDSLKRFLQQNRRYEDSPELGFQYERLQRRVNLRQQVFISLSESYERAKMDEVRNTPVITIVESPDEPARPDRRRLLLKGFLGLTLGGMAGLFWAFGTVMMATNQRLNPDDYAEFVRLKEQVKEEVRGLWRRLRRRAG